MEERSVKVANWKGGTDMDRRVEWEGGGVPLEFVLTPRKESTFSPLKVSYAPFKIIFT